MATTKQWLDWLKCNVLEFVILVLIVVLLVKVYSAPAVENVPAVTEVAVETPLAEATVPEAPAEAVPVETTVGGAEGIIPPVAEETLAEIPK